MSEKLSPIVKVDFECGCSVQFVDEYPVSKTFCDDAQHTDNSCGCYSIGGKLVRCARHCRSRIAFNVLVAVVILLVLGIASLLIKYF